MEDNVERLINSIKQQAEAFLLDAGEFYPFGSYINTDDNVIPVAAYVEHENDMPPSTEVLEILENSFKDYLKDKKCSVCAIGVDTLIHKTGESFDVLQVRLFGLDKNYEKYYKYFVRDGYVEFLSVVL